MHKIYCIIGRSASGKSSLTKKAAEKLQMNVVKSYTTRKPRKNEDIDDSDHIFINEEDVEKYRADMVACTERVGYCSFATRQQLTEGDFYIINPAGYYELLTNTADMDTILVTILITVPYNINKKRATKRGNYKEWEENYQLENDEFTTFTSSGLVDYMVLNDGTLDDGVQKLIHIIERDRAKDGF